jgi:hypothetical protein
MIYLLEHYHYIRQMKSILICLSCFFLCVVSLQAQKVSDSQIRQLIESFQEDPRGPYKEIRWFCDDGSIIPPKEKCPEPGGVQRASNKTEVIDLAEKNHIFLGSNTGHHGSLTDFLDD